MSKKEIVVVPNENILLIQNKIYHESSTEKDHGKMLIDFCDKFGIKVTFNENDPSQICALELAALGHFVIIIENNLTVLFVPNEISTNQIEWIKGKYRTLNRFTVLGFIYNDEHLISIEEDGEEIINPLKEIYSIMKKKYKKTKEGENKCTKN